MNPLRIGLIAAAIASAIIITVSCARAETYDDASFCAEIADMNVMKQADLQGTDVSTLWDKMVAEKKCFGPIKVRVEPIYIIEQYVVGDEYRWIALVHVWQKRVWEQAYAIFTTWPMEGAPKIIRVDDDGVDTPLDRYGNSPYKNWAGKQEVMYGARPRFNCFANGMPTAGCYCCDGSEIVKTKFRPVKGEKYYEDGWEWLNPRTNRWEHVPDDIIHWSEPTPTKEAVMFVYPKDSTGIPRCFFPPQDGGG